MSARHTADKDVAVRVTLTDAERRELAFTFHGAQWISPERAACVERIIANRILRAIEPEANAESGVGRVWSCCGHAERFHGPEVPGCVECRCTRVTPPEVGAS
jgi:hypothetical protein